MKHATPHRVELLQDAIGYLHSFREECRNQNEHEDLSISLRLLGAVLRNEAVQCDPFTWACYMAVGCSPARYLKRRADREAFKEKELIGAIPDYDPAEAERVNKARARRKQGPRSIREEMAENIMRTREDV